MQRCYPDEYQEYTYKRFSIRGSLFPIEAFEIYFSKETEMIMYPNACVLLSFELNQENSITVHYIGRINETACIQHQPGVKYFQIKFPPQIIFRNVESTNMNSKLDLSMFGGAERIKNIFDEPSFEKRYKRFLTVVAESSLGMEINELINEFIGQCVDENLFEIADIVERIHYSPRYIRQIIKEHMSISVKRLYDILRLQNIIGSRDYDENLNCVFDNGFFDQTHLNKYLKKLTGLNYSSFKKVMKEKNI